MILMTNLYKMQERKDEVYKFIINNFSREQFLKMIPNDEYDKSRDVKERGDPECYCEGYYECYCRETKINNSDEETRYDVFEGIENITYNDFLIDQKDQVDNADDVVITLFENAITLINNNRLLYHDDDILGEGNRDHQKLTGFILCNGNPVFTGA